MEREIMEAIAKNDVVILCGPTGYGAKLTQFRIWPRVCFTCTASTDGHPELHI